MMIWHLGGWKRNPKGGGVRGLTPEQQGGGQSRDRPARKISRMPGKWCLPLSCAVIPSTVP